MRPAPPPPHPSVSASPEPLPAALPPAKVTSEVSKWGWFALTVSHSKNKEENATCTLSFRSKEGRVSSLFTVRDCLGDVPGVTTLGATRRVGATSFPDLRQREEYHLFEIATARGGNGVPGRDYWVVDVGEIQGCDEKCPGAMSYALGENLDLENAYVEVSPLYPDSPARLVLEAPSTTTDKGVRFEVTFMADLEVARRDLPLAVTTAKSKVTRVLNGPMISAGAHFADFHPIIGAGAEQIVIDDVGACDLSTLPASPRRMTLEVTEWSDGHTSNRCVSLERR
jgi:hypothetical protein